MATRAKYYRVRQDENQTIKDQTDILIKVSQSYGKYVSRALTLFFGEDKKKITIKAAEKMIEKSLWVAEVLRRKVPNLHEVIDISERVVVDIFKPKEEGLNEVKKERFLTLASITLTLTPTPQDKKAIGYQPPLSGPDFDFLTKELWEKQTKERAIDRQERGRQRDNRGSSSQERQQERRRGGRKS